MFKKVDDIIVIKAIWILTLITIGFACSNRQNNNQNLSRDSLSVFNHGINEEIVSSLLDQLNSVEIIKNSIIVDSLLRIDPHNALGNWYKGAFELNNRDSKTSMIHLKRYINEEPDWYLPFIYYGMVVEREQGIAKAIPFYKKAYSFGGDSIFFKQLEIEFLIQGKDHALELIKNSSNISELEKLQFLNDIEKYSGGGLNTFFPWWFHDDYPHQYYITIPDSLYIDSNINSMEKVELYYARKGINVDITGTDKGNKSMYLSTSDPFRKDFENITTFEFKKL